MGVTTETLRLLLDADMKGGVREVEKFGKTSEREYSRAKSSMDKWGAGLSKAGAGMIGFGAAALVGLGKAAMASEDAQLSAEKLQNSIANNPRLAGKSADSFIDLANAIQDKTAADADAIVAGEAVLAQGRFTADQIKELTPLVVDLARKKGIDEVAAFTMASKAASGNVGALKRAGIAVDETKAKSDAYGATVDALRNSVGGFAEQEGQTFAGSLQRLKNEMGDVVEGVGAGAVDAFTDLAGAAGFVTDRFTEMSPATQSVIGKVATYGSVALIAAGGVSMLVGQAIKMRQNFSVLADGASTAIDAIGGLKGAAALAAGAAGIAGLAFAINEVSGGANQMEIDMDTLAASIDDTTRAGQEALRKDIEQADSLGVLKEMVSHVADENFVLAQSLVDAADKADLQHTSMSDLKDIISSKKDEDIQGAAASQEHAEAIDEGTQALDEEADAAKNAEDALKQYLDTLRGTFDPLFAMSDALRDNQQAHADLNTKQLEAFAAQETYNEAVRKYGEDSKAARDAAVANMEAQDNLTDAESRARGAVVDLQGAAAQLKFEMDENGLTAGRAREQFIQMATSMGYTQGEAEQLAEDFGFTTQKAQELGQQRPEPRVSVTGVTAANLGLLSVRNHARSIPTRHDTHVTASGTQYAIGQLDTLARKINNLPSSANFHVSVGGGGGLTIAGGGVVPDYLAVGGFSRGPRGTDTVPAWLTPGEMVMNKGQQAELLALASGGGRGGGSPTIVQNFYIEGVIAERELMKISNKASRKGRGLNP